MPTKPVKLIVLRILCVEFQLTMLTLFVSFSCFSIRLARSGYLFHINDVNVNPLNLAHLYSKRVCH